MKHIWATAFGAIYMVRDMDWYQINEVFSVVVSIKIRQLNS